LKIGVKAHPHPALSLKGEGKNYGIDYTIAFCALTDSLALWERVRVRAIFMFCGRA
jgi:hypothetical protein